MPHLKCAHQFGKIIFVKFLLWQYFKQYKNITNNLLKTNKVRDNYLQNEISNQSSLGLIRYAPKYIKINLLSYWWNSIVTPESLCTHKDSFCCIASTDSLETHPKNTFTLFIRCSKAKQTFTGLHNLLEEIFERENLLQWLLFSSFSFYLPLCA